MGEAAGQPWDLECDVLVAGSGGGALAGALLAARAGLRVVVVEKTGHFGGTTAYSGGALWVPLSGPTQRAGMEDSLANVRQYLEACVGPAPNALLDAYIAAGPGVIAELEQDPWLEFEWRPFPDYFCEAPGAHSRGRSIYALPFDITGHDDAVQHLRPPLPPAKGGQREPAPMVIGGRAFLARMLVSLGETGARLLREAALTDLVLEGGRVVGARVESEGAQLRIRAGRGVLLAAGGFERNDALRRARQALGADWTLGAPGNTGDALRAAIDAGADTELLEECWWAPGMMLPDGTPGLRLFERGKPHSILVNGAGVRFANESWPYDRLARAMIEGQAGGVSHLPCWLVVDQGHVERYGFGAAPPGTPLPPEWFDTGTIVTAPSLRELASAIGVPAGALEATVAAFNEDARTGVDRPFHRGELAFDRFFGDREHSPNGNLGPVEAAPFYAWKVVPADLGTKGGLRCDATARVLRPDGSVLPGLYAAGNTMASWTRHCYPGPGVPIGSCVVFAALAVRHMASQ